MRMHLYPPMGGMPMGGMPTGEQYEDEKKDQSREVLPFNTPSLINENTTKKTKRKKGGCEVVINSFESDDHLENLSKFYKSFDSKNDQAPYYAVIKNMPTASGSDKIDLLAIAKKEGDIKTIGFCKDNGEIPDEKEATAIKQNDAYFEELKRSLSLFSNQKRKDKFINLAKEEVKYFEKCDISIRECEFEEERLYDCVIKEKADLNIGYIHIGGNKYIQFTIRSKDGGDKTLIEPGKEKKLYDKQIYVSDKLIEKVGGVYKETNEANKKHNLRITCVDDDGNILSQFVQYKGIRKNKSEINQEEFVNKTYKKDEGWLKKIISRVAGYQLLENEKTLYRSIDEDQLIKANNNSSSLTYHFNSASGLGKYASMQSMVSLGHANGFRITRHGPIKGLLYSHTDNPQENSNQTNVNVSRSLQEPTKEGTREITTNNSKTQLPPLAIPDVATTTGNRYEHTWYSGGTRNSAIIPPPTRGNIPSSTLRFPRRGSLHESTIDSRGA